MSKMKTVFCKFLDSIDKNGIIKIKLLGRAKNDVDKPTLPGWKDVVTEILIDKKYAEGLDIVNGTPIIDIKPYTPQYDRVEKAKVPDWVNKLVF